ncbi:MAG: outer membrane protein assembly factor BamD [Bacteroidales bacterium]|nr:outer membrane protein assembly factor BamD [Bacteroidales bacterium]
MRHIRLYILAAVAILAASCKSQYEVLLNSNDVDAKYKAAFDYFESGKYNKAANMFESLSVLTSGTAKDDTVQYYWGLSNYNFKDYYTAETNFQKFTTNYPRSPFSENARYLRLDCLYRQTLRYELDQTPTNVCLAAIAEYLREFPVNDHLDDCDRMVKELNQRLDTKAYESAKLYYKMEDYLAARVALRNVLKDDSDNIYREDILFYTAKASFKYAQLSVPAKQRERYLTFVDDYLNFKGEMPESKYMKELDSLYERAQRALGKRSESYQKEIKEKEFAKERRKLEKALKAEQAENK